VPTSTFQFQVKNPANEHVNNTLGGPMKAGEGGKWQPRETGRKNKRKTTKGKEKSTRNVCSNRETAYLNFEY